jgi:hypothetical protein
MTKIAEAETNMVNKRFMIFSSARFPPKHFKMELKRSSCAVLFQA